MPGKSDDPKLEDGPGGTQNPPAADGTPSDPPKSDEKPAWQKAIDDLEAKLAATTAELTKLRTPPTQKQEKKPETDYEEMLFTDPNAAVARIKEELRREISGELTNKYSKDQSERTFWADFYKANDDLKEDDDLVRAILAKNMADLADLPVKKASDRLAELTRERIGRYTKQTKGSSRAVAEGSTHGTGKGKTPEEPPKPTTLSDIIKARRSKRLSKATAA